MREELSNGGSKRQLASSERKGVLTLALGKMRWNEREKGWSRSRTSTTASDGLPVRQERGAEPAPLFLVRLVRDVVSLKPTRTTVPPGRAQFIKPNAFLFSKLT
jgi:hypothetical protein